MDKRHLFNQFCYLFTAQYVGLAISIIGGVALTRLLDPAAFGVLAAFLFYLSSFNWISEFGWDQGFMTHREIPLQDAAATHAMIRVITGLVPLFFFFGLKVFRIQFSFQEYWSVLFVLSISYLLERISFTPKILLERQYRLGSCAAFELTATAMSYASALFFAYSGFGAMSLAIQRVVEKGIICFGYLYTTSWGFSIRGKWEVVKIYLYSFGLATYVGSLVSLIIYDFMGWFVAWYVDVYDAGLYAKAFNLATFPLLLTAIASRMTVPLYSNYQGDVEKIRSIFVKAQVMKMVVLIPMQLFLVGFSWWWIPRILGAQWMPLIPLYSIMAVYGLARSFFDDVPNVLTYGFKKPWVLTQSQTIQALIIIAFGFMIIPRYKAFGSCLTMSLSMSVAMFYVWYRVLKQLACSKESFVGATRDYWAMAKTVKDVYAKR